jgi:hypothetical protein
MATVELVVNDEGGDGGGDLGGGGLNTCIGRVTDCTT